MSKKKETTKPEQIKFTFQSRIEMIDPNKLTPDPKNPRLNKRKDFDRLVNSIRQNPNMLMIRPVVFRVIGKQWMIIAGHQRHKACVHLGLKEIPCINATKLSKEEIKHLQLWDNENVGKFDWEELETWGDTFGIATPDKDEPHKYNNSNAEMPIVPKYDEKYYAVMIVVESEMDFANLITLLNLDKAKDYKNNSVKQSQVISFKDFTKLVEQWKK
jgi:hypothetical protein